MQKWYLGLLVPFLDLPVANHPVLSFGFRKDAMIEDVVGNFREILNAFDIWGAATAWNGVEIVAGSQDVETAFDNVDHEEEAVGMIESEVPLPVVAALVKENVGVEIVYDIPDVGFTEVIAMQRGLVQGRIDSPARFRIFLDWVLKPCVAWWNEANYGIRWGLKGEHLFNHPVWADNVWLFATSVGMYQAMLDMLTFRLEQAKLRWKPKSLDFLLVNIGDAKKKAKITVHSGLHAEGERGEATLHYTQKEHLDVLGVRLDSTGSTEASITAKMASARKGVFADLEAWRNKGSKAAKVEAFARQVHPRVLHGSRAWVLTDKVLHSFRKEKTRLCVSSWGYDERHCPAEIWKHHGRAVRGRVRKSRTALTNAVSCQFRSRRCVPPSEKLGD